MKKVLITDPIHDESVSYLKGQGLDVHIMLGLSEQEIKDLIEDYNALICRTSTKVTRDILLSAKNLECIGVHATGWDHIDYDTASKNGVLLLGYPPDKENFLKDRLNGSFIPAAEYVIMTMLSVTKKLIRANESMKSGRWEKYDLSGGELYGKTLGIIGLGRIGSLVAERASAFGMRVIAYHPRISDSDFKLRKAESVCLDELYEQSDFISIHVPKTAETMGLVEETAFDKMLKKPVIINTSRASVIDEKALEIALSTDKLSAVVLDVFDNAPKNVNWELVKHPKVIATPHIAGVSDEGLLRVSSHIAKLVADYLIRGEIRGQIT
jgi:D-3-phosphoglycerate dehydrogenase / 2-oxoglutarate reductase